MLSQTRASPSIQPTFHASAPLERRRRRTTSGSRDEAATHLDTARLIIHIMLSSYPVIQGFAS